MVQAGAIAATSASVSPAAQQPPKHRRLLGVLWQRCMRVWATIGGRRPAHPPRHPLRHAPIASSPPPCRPRSPPPASPAGELAGHTDWSRGRARSIAGPPGCRGPGWAPNPLRPRCSQGLPGLRPPQRGGPGPAAACRGSQPPAAAGGPGGTGGSAGGPPRAGRPLRRRQGGAGALREGNGEAVRTLASTWAACRASSSRPGGVLGCGARSRCRCVAPWSTLAQTLFVTLHPSAAPPCLQAEIINNVRSAATLERDAPGREETMAAVRKDINDWVARYRR